MTRPRVVCIGAGPASLTAAYLLTKAGAEATVLEADPRYVGGISRTVEYKGYRFDIGGHRFFSKSQEIEDLWSELLPHDMLERPRSSRIFYRGRFFSYPLKAFEALFQLGLLESLRCVASYAYAQIFPVKDPRTFEDWVSNKFGKRLFGIFFKTYTEKVWGMSCREISADWAQQRIKGLSLATAIWNAIKPARRGGNRGAVVKSLIESFRYPRKGPGMLWEATADAVRAGGGEVRLGARVVSARRDEAAGVWRIAFESGGVRSDVECDHVISSAPLSQLVGMLDPACSEAARGAGRSLRYRDFLTVALMLRRPAAFDDNWIYIHEPSVKVGRIQNFRSWSPELLPDDEHECYGLEYFCNEGDGTWAMSDADLIELAKSELVKIGLAKPGSVIDGCVVRQPKAYPVYDEDYAGHVDVIRAELARYPGLQVIGRNGMHKYNNQDHAMMTGILAARNILSESLLYDVWQVNQDAEYHESGTRPDSGASGLRSVPRRAA